MIKAIIFLIFSFLVLNDSIFAQETALFPVEKNRKAGYIDQTGKEVIPLKFDEAWDFSEGLAPVRIGDDWGYVDKVGKLVIKPQFFSASQFSEGFAEVGIYWPRRKIINSTVGYSSYINKRGEVITEYKFGVAFSFSDGFAEVVTEDSKRGFIDHTGKMVLNFDAWTGFSNGLAMFKTNSNMPDSKVGYIDKTGKVVIPAQYRFGTNFLEGLACVSNDTGYGFIDVEGNTKIDFIFGDCQFFSEGLAAVLIDGKYGFIDTSGKIIIEPKFAEVSAFSDGVAVVRLPANSEESKDAVRDWTLFGNITETKDSLYGVIDKSGNFIIPPKYVQIRDFQNGLSRVNLGDSYLVHGETDRWGYLNKEDKIVWKSF